MRQEPPDGRDEPSTPPHDRGHDSPQSVAGDATILSARGHQVQPLLRPVYDADGRASTNFSSISTTQASLLTFSPVGSIIEDPLFTGGKANCTVTSGQLTLTPDTLDNYPDVTVLSWWGVTGGSAEAGQYNFAVGMDLGSVKRCRITSHVKVEAINESDYGDSKIGPIDTWPDIDGTRARRSTRNAGASTTPSLMASATSSSRATWRRRRSGWATPAG